MITTLVIFKKMKEGSQKINFLILPKIGETICYCVSDKKYFMVDDIVHTVNPATNVGEQLLHIYVSEKQCSED